MLRAAANVVCTTAVAAQFCLRIGMLSGRGWLHRTRVSKFYQATTRRRRSNSSRQQPLWSLLYDYPVEAQHFLRLRRSNGIGNACVPW